MIPRKHLLTMSAVFLLLLFYIVIDLGLGYFILKKDEIRIRDPYYHHGLKPMSHTAANWGGLNYDLFTNSLGFKDSYNREVSKTTYKNRIMFLGDSFTEGLGYEFDKTFTGIISDSLKNTHEILNAGVTSYSPVLYYYKTMYLINAGYKIDQIIVMLDISDIQDELIYQNFLPDKKNSLMRSFDIMLSNISFSYNYFFRNIIKRVFIKEPETSDSFLEEKIEKRGSWTYDDSVYSEWGKKGLTKAAESMKKLQNLCLKNRIGLTLAVYPWPEQILNDTPESKQVEFWSGFCVTNNVDFVDLFPYFFDEPDKKGIIEKYFIDGDCHWNAIGHKFVAVKILENIK